MNDQERKELVEYRINRAKATLAEVDLQDHIINEQPGDKYHHRSGNASGHEEKEAVGYILIIAVKLFCKGGNFGYMGSKVLCNIHEFMGWFVGCKDKINEEYPDASNSFRSWKVLAATRKFVSICANNLSISVEN